MSARFILVLLALFHLATGAKAQSPGEVFLVDRWGNHVEANSFSRSDAVYLAGGPGPSCVGPGLPDGDYYYQITDPEGTVLLSPDPLSERTIRAAGGFLDQYLGMLHPSSNKGPCGSLYLRLARYLPTPYPAREYKVWLTRVEDYDPLGSSLFGFDPALSKSVNFRVAAPGPQSIVRGQKFYDQNDDGIWDPITNPFEVPLGGWRVELWKDGVLDGVTFTDRDGWYYFIRDRDAGTYEVREISPDGFVNDGTPGATWLATTDRSGNVNTTSEFVAGPEFGNVGFELTIAAGRPTTFWCDRNDGLPILAANDPLWRMALNTRNGAPVNLRTPVSNDNPNASIFTVGLPPKSIFGAFANFKAWCEKNPHDHAGFLLSREVAATLLNNTVGFMQGDVYIDRFQDGVLVSLDDMLTGAIGLLSQTGAGLTGPNDPFQALRALMIACTNEFKNINETADPTSPQVIYSKSESPPRFTAPY